MLRVGVKPKPLMDDRVAGLALAEPLFAEVRLIGRTVLLPSLVPGRLPPLLPFRLRLEAGRGGGPIWPAGEKKLDRRLSLLSFGVTGSAEMLSIVRSLSDGRDAFRGVALGGGSKYWVDCTGSKGDSSCQPPREAARKLSRPLSWS